MTALNYYLHNDPHLPLAWGPWFAHEYMSYFGARSVDRLMTLPPVAVKSNPHYGEKLWPIGPRHIDLYKESYQESRKIDPLGAFDLKKRNGDYSHDVPSGKTIEPWKVLIIYSTEPDLYADDDLLLHKNQKITGGSHGWRHMHFKVLGTTYGIAPQSYRMHKDLARLAFDNGNDYWGWRYLSRCAHYLADLGHPFHVKALPASFLLKKIFARSKLFEMVSAIHQSFEIYVERRFREGFKPFRDAIVQGVKESLASKGEADVQLRDYIQRARQKHDPIFYFFYEKFGSELLDIFAQKDPQRHMNMDGNSYRCVPDAVNMLFAEANLARLEYLDVMTGNVLFDVGKMLGALFNEFADHAGQATNDRKNQ